MSKTYCGKWYAWECVVTVDGRPLPLRLDLRAHSPTGFAWGYGGSGPSQLALALLADHIGDDDSALALYQFFKWDVVVMLTPGKDWMLTSVDIDNALQTIRNAQVG